MKISDPIFYYKKHHLLNQSQLPACGVKIDNKKIEIVEVESTSLDKYVNSHPFCGNCRKIYLKNSTKWG
jgi:hypothetical protein